MGVYNGEPIGHNAVRPTGESAWKIFFKPTHYAQIWL